MTELTLVLCIVGAVVVSSFLSRFIPKISTPLVQIVLGAAAAQLPFFPDVTLDPELFMVLFIAPLLYLEARSIDKTTLLKNLKLSLSLAIGLAIATMVAVGYVTHAAWPAVPLAAAFALGAALGPTDAVAVTSLSHEATLSERQRGILKGESLFNDASGIVGFQFSILAAITGTFSVGAAAEEFAVSFFGPARLGARHHRQLAVRIDAILRLGNHHITHPDGVVPAVPVVFRRGGGRRFWHSHGCGRRADCSI